MENPEQIPGELLNRIANFGRVYLLDTVSSTNDYAFNLAKEKQEPAVIIARRQTKGRGRFRRHWFADKDSLTFSVLFFSEPRSFSPARITQIAGLALCRAIKINLGQDNTGVPHPLIRWPNDILITGKKVAGILCEQRRNAMVVGVGVNINQTSLPENLPEAGSLRIAYNRPFDRFVLINAFLTEFFSCLERLQKGDPTLWAEIRDRSAILHHRVEIRTLLQRHVGTVIDIDDEGRIVLRTDAGKLTLFNVGQVKQLR